MGWGCRRERNYREEAQRRKDCTMTTRIDARFAELAKQGRSAFVTFLMACDPVE